MVLNCVTMLFNYIWKCLIKYGTEKQIGVACVNWCPRHWLHLVIVITGIWGSNGRLPKWSLQTQLSYLYHLHMPALSHTRTDFHTTHTQSAVQELFEAHQRQQPCPLFCSALVLLLPSLGWQGTAARASLSPAAGLKESKGAANGLHPTWLSKARALPAQHPAPAMTQRAIPFLPDQLSTLLSNLSCCPPIAFTVPCSPPTSLGAHGAAQQELAHARDASQLCWLLQEQTLCCMQAIHRCIQSGTCSDFLSGGIFHINVLLFTPFHWNILWKCFFWNKHFSTSGLFHKGWLSNYSLLSCERCAFVRDQIALVIFSSSINTE